MSDAILLAIGFVIGVAVGSVGSLIALALVRANDQRSA
jgi:hypothetical protein